MTEWRLLFVFPHLSIQASDQDGAHLDLGRNDIAIAPLDDPRVVEILGTGAVVGQFLSAFKNEYGESLNPPVLVAHEKLLARFGRSVAPIVAFRNVVAMSDVLLTRASGMGPFAGRSWSDSYDFHPAQIALDHSRVDLFTPAMDHFVVPIEDLTFSADPGLPRTRSGPFDDEISRPLARLWQLRFLRRSGSDIAGPVFRSLEIAYHAASVRFKNYGSIHEAGLGAILWPSAIDVLAGVGVSHVSRGSGLDLIGEYEWSRRRLNARRFKLMSGKKGNLVQCAYDHLYEARNRFVHGNKVRARLLRPFRHPDSPPLLSLASTVYRTALLAYLCRHFDADVVETDFDNYFTTFLYEHHLCAAVDGFD